MYSRQVFTLPNLLNVCLLLNNLCIIELLYILTYFAFAHIQFVASLGTTSDSARKSGKSQLAVVLFSEETTHPPDNTDF